MPAYRTDYHWSLNPLSRSANANAVHAAAYRSGERLEDANGVVYDYTRRQRSAEVVATRLVVPKAGPQWPLAAGRQGLWRSAEAAETRKNSVVAYEIDVALPHEFDERQCMDLLLRQAQAISDEHGVAVDVSLHWPTEKPAPAPDGAAPQRELGDSTKNKHGHLLVTTRVLTHDGLGEKVRDFSDKVTLGPATVLHWRERWEQMENDALAAADIDTRVSCKKLSEQGVNREATKHEGRRARYGSQRELDSEIVAHNAGVRARNKVRAEREAEIARLERVAAKLAAEVAADEAAEVARDRALVAARRRQQPSTSTMPKLAPRPKASAIAPADDQVQQAWLEKRVQNRLPRYPNAAEPDVRALARYWRDNRLPNGAWEYINKAGRVVDAGDRITADHGNGVEIDAMIRLAKAKAWSEIQFTGSDDFKARAMAAALRAGLDIATTTTHDADILAKARAALAPKPAAAADPLAAMKAALDRVAPKPAESPAGDNEPPSPPVSDPTPKLRPPSRR